MVTLNERIAHSGSENLKIAVDLLEDARKAVESLDGLEPAEITLQSARSGWREMLKGAERLDLEEDDRRLVSGYASIVRGMHDEAYGRAWHRINQGISNDHLDHYRKAVSCYAHAAEVLEGVTQTDVKSLLAISHSHLGDVYALMRKPDQAAYHFAKTIECSPQGPLATEAKKELAMMGLSPSAAPTELRAQVRSEVGASKSKSVAIALAVLLGVFGAHGFYLGNSTMARSMIGLMLVSLVLDATGVWSAKVLLFIFCCYQAYRYHRANDEEFGERYVLGKAWV
jgi:tetratricopeptide (TPR) repeat protein